MSEIRAISDESLAQAVEIVRDGGLIVIPTDTVYGVACDPRNIEAIRKVHARHGTYRSRHRQGHAGRAHSEFRGRLACAARYRTVGRHQCQPFRR